MNQHLFLYLNSIKFLVSSGESLDAIESDSVVVCAEIFKEKQAHNNNAIISDFFIMVEIRLLVRTKLGKKYNASHGLLLIILVIYNGVAFLSCLLP